MLVKILKIFIFQIVHFVLICHVKIKPACVIANPEYALKIQNEVTMHDFD